MFGSVKQYRQFIQDIILNLQALAIILERQGYAASCYVPSDDVNAASFMVSLSDNHLIRFLVSNYGITWTEMQDDRELMRLEGSEAVLQLQELSDLIKFNLKNKNEYSEIDRLLAANELDRVLASLDLLLT
ncbi:MULTISPECIES: DUF1815 family protein [unclassified Nostoc]|uniref:DUF1815 family protein n=1 Tax=unclassified Nostoc TaxID=2593658 RepID=UPI0028937E6A|nr:MULTISPECIES: DUF1815 family protein [unclassified Nostoc]